MSTLTRITKNSLVILLARLIEVGSGFVITMILCRYLEPRLFGDFAFINALVLAFQPLVNLELNTILIREISRDQDSRAELLGSGIFIKFCLLLIFWCAAIGIDLSLGLSGYMKIGLYIAVLGETFQQIYWVFNTLYLAYERMEYDTLMSLIFRTISLTGIILIAVLIPDKSTLSLAFILIFTIFTLAQFIRMIAVVMVSQKFLILKSLHMTYKSVIRLISQTWIMGIATFCTGLSLRIDVYILKALKGSEAVSIFHLPHILVLQVQIIAVAIVTALFPILSRLGKRSVQKQRFHEVRDLSLRVLTVLGLWTAMGIFFFSDVLIRIIGGRMYLSSVLILNILACCIPILFLNYLCANLLTSIGRQAFLIYGASFSLVVNVVLDLLWVPIWGAAGAAWATLISYFIQLVIVLFLLRISEKKSLNIMSTMLFPFILAAGITFLAASLPVKFPLNIMVNSLIWGGALAVLLYFQPRELTDPLRKFLPGKKRN